MKFSVGICILMGFWLNACTTEGEGSEFITKLASREEANEIIAIPNVSGLLGYVSYAEMGIYIDSSFIRQEIQRSYDYDVTTNTWSRIDSNGDFAPDFITVDRKSYQFEPSSTNGIPTQSSIKIVYESSSDNWLDGEFDGRIWGVTIDNFPVWFPLYGSYNQPSSGTAYSRAIHESPQESVLAETNYSFTTSSINNGTATGNGQLKYSREIGEPLKYDISVRFKYEQTSDAENNFYSTRYIDFGGYGYKRSNYESAWTPYELNF